MPTTLEAFRILASNLLENIDVIPGSTLVKEYVKRSYQHDPFRVALEAFLLFFAFRYLTTKKYQPNSNFVELTEKEINDLIEEWQPEPLISEATENEKEELRNLIAVKEHKNNEITLADGEIMKNWSATNFIGLHNNAGMKSKCREIVKEYGVGTCGPSGFYGTLDIHLDLQNDLARLLGTEAGIIYAQGYSAVASIIPAFSKKGDVIVADEAVNFAIQRGITLSKSQVYFYKHNDMADLERILKQIDEEAVRKRKALTRRFIVVEGLYQNTGTILSLPALVQLKKQYKYRVILDESLSFGALGPRCLGVTDYHSVDPTDIDAIVGSMSASIGSAGGFCVGGKHVIDHQVLSSAAYCFSASLPAFLTAAAVFNLKLLKSEGPEMAKSLARNIQIFRKTFAPCPSAMELKGHGDSPLLLVRFREDANLSAAEERRALNAVVLGLREKGHLVSMLKCVEKDERLPLRPALKICLSSTFTPDEVADFARLLLKACSSLV